MLVEVVVVLLLLGVAAALVAPALLPPGATPESALGELVRDARTASLRRGETMHVTLDAAGRWRLDGAASPTEGALAAGQLGDYDGPPFTLVVSPIGTCAFDARSSAAARTVTIEPFTCEVRAP